MKNLHSSTVMDWETHVLPLRHLALWCHRLLFSEDWKSRPFSNAYYCTAKDEEGKTFYVFSFAGARHYTNDRKVAALVLCLAFDVGPDRLREEISEHPNAPAIFKPLEPGIVSWLEKRHQPLSAEIVDEVMQWAKVIRERQSVNPSASGDDRNQRWVVAEGVDDQVAVLTKSLEG